MFNRRKRKMRWVWRRLLKRERYTPGQFRLAFRGRQIHYVDAASCASAGAAVFDHHIYDFSSKSPAPRIIDCGANIGLAVLYWKTRFPQARITAFEPDASVFRTLQHNVLSWDLGDVELLQAAVSDRAGQAAFVSEGADAGYLQHTRGMGQDARQDSSSPVKTVPLGDYLDSPVSLLKIDIEGAEVDVLLSVANRLANVERVFVEWHSFAGQDQRLHELLEVLVGSGFRIHCQPEFCSPTPFLSLRVDNGMDNRLNIFAVRPSG